MTDMPSNTIPDYRASPIKRRRSTKAEVESRSLAARQLPPNMWGDVAIARYGLKLKRQGRELVGPCPKCGGHDRFAINVTKGFWNCRGCHRGGDAIDLVRNVEGCSFREALDVLAGATRERNPGHGDLRPSVDRDRRREHASSDDNSLLVARIWEQSLPLGSKAIAYFGRRGVGIEAVPEHGGLRWHPRCPWEGGDKPCVIGRYTTAVGNEPRGIWRRPIGGGKPKALGPTAGCVIRLWPDDTIASGLVLGEGPETVLAAATRIKHRGTLLRPAWAAGSAGNIAKFPVLAGIEALTILVDNDANGSGQRAGEECKIRWEAAAREVTLLTPTVSGADFNNVVLA